MNISSNSPIRTLYFSFVLLNACSTHAAVVRTVALSGEPAAGTPSGQNFQSFDFPPQLNDSGQIAFNATLTGAGVDTSNNEGIWSEGAGSLALVARTGNHAPGTASGVKYGSASSPFTFGVPVFNDSGKTAFRTTVLGAEVDETNNVGIWSESSGSLALVARTGSQAAGTPNGAYYWSLEPPLLNNLGNTAFFGTLVGAGVELENYRGIWSGGASNLDLVVRQGTHAPGTPAGVSFDTFGVFESGEHVLNGNGDSAFLGYLTGSGVDESNKYGIWTGSAAGLGLIARSGSPAPGAPNSENFNFFTNPVLNDAGQTAFWAGLSGSGVKGIWSQGSGSLAPVATTATPPPGTPPGVSFSDFGLSPVLNNAGQTAFWATLAGSGVIFETNDQGIWSEGSGNLSLIARSGSQAPGTPSGVVFNQFSFGQSLIALNDAGQTAFFASVTGSGVDGTNTHGLWATDQSGALQLIARYGSLLEVAPGDVRTIAGLSFFANTGNSDGRPSSFNNVGQLAFVAYFTDGSSGVFVSNAVAHLPGDFNHDGTVDAADYVTWRKNPGGIYTPDDYTTWRTHFGQSLSFIGNGSGASANAIVPEPAAGLLILIAVIFGRRSRRRSVS
jgi:hypothetical protein